MRINQFILFLFLLLNSKNFRQLWYKDKEIHCQRQRTNSQTMITYPKLQLVFIVHNSVADQSLLCFTIHKILTLTGHSQPLAPPTTTHCFQNYTSLPANLPAPSGAASPSRHALPQCCLVPCYMPQATDTSYNLQVIINCILTQKMEGKFEFSIN